MPEQTSTCGTESEQVNNSVALSPCKNRADIGDGVRTSFDSVVHGWKFGSVGFLPSSHDKWSEERFNTVYQEISSTSPDDYRGNWLDYEGLKHTLDYCKRLGAGETTYLSVSGVAETCPYPPRFRWCRGIFSDLEAN